MPTLYGPWKGSGSGQARIVMEYTRTYSADRTDAIFNGSAYIEADTSVSDSTNSWEVNTPGNDYSGSNLAISIGSGGGRKKIRDYAFTTNGSDKSVTASVSGIEYYGTTINATLTHDNGSLAPFLTNTNYVAGSITTTSATISAISGNGNGSALNNTQVQYNTSATDVGASSPTAGGYTSTFGLGGLTPGTTYYYRVRVSNSGYGWGAWGPWKSFTTLATVPTVSEGWSAGSIDQTTAVVSGIAAVSNGGAAIDQTLIRVNTSPVDAGGTDFVAAGVPASMNLSGLLPGTTYYAKVYMHNSVGWGGSSWKSFTTLPGVSVNVNGVWKNAVIYVKVDGQWKPAVRYVKVGGAWKQ